MFSLSIGRKLNLPLRGAEIKSPEWNSDFLEIMVFLMNSLKGHKRTTEKSYQPVDEAHRETDTELADDLIQLVNPKIMLKITATPKSLPLSFRYFTKESRLR